MTLEYKGIVVEQLRGAPRIALFSAPSHEIARWAGIPQRRRLGDVETAGFQREEKQKRVNEIAAFMGDSENVIQNPLLAAVQDTRHVRYILDEPPYCRVEISMPDYGQLTLSDLLDTAIKELISRAPTLEGRTPPSAITSRVKETLAHLSPSDAPRREDQDWNEEQQIDEDSATASESIDASIALFDDDSQVTDFYDELMARKNTLDELGAAANDLESIAGFSKDFLISLVKPVVLVDGQHRLRGALQALSDFEESSQGCDLIADLIDQGLSPQEARDRLAELHGRQLPISLLLSDSPAEHVFQFVVVNQKATQMSSALLGTIVSTSLTQDEMDPIRDRLRRAGIELEGSRAVSYMRRNPDSPFYGLVSTGVGGDKPGALPWTVLTQLVNIVRSLKGADSYHPPKVDHAGLWRKNGFQDSGLVDVQLPEDERLERWSANDGPWREMFLRLFRAIRDKFGNTSDPAAQNYWGSTRSNLFNMVSLRILTNDFFDFIRNRSFQDLTDIDRALDDWIGDLSPEYFARDWRMGGTKKDQPGIKLAWSSTWSEYRLNRDRLPRVEKYNPGGKGVAG